MLTDAIFPGLIEALPDAVVITGEDGRILLVNQQTERLFGYARSELLDQPVSTLIPDELRSRHVGHQERYVRHPTTRPMGIGMELLGQRKDGERFPVEISLAPLTHDGELYITSVIRDVSERHRLRNELEMQEERQRIAMDLHDGTIQSIYAVGLGLELALDDVAERPIEAGREIERSMERLNEVIADVRSFIFDLRPAQADGDLAHALSATVDEFRGLSSARVVLDVPASLSGLSEERAVAMLRVAREALSNIRKHARAGEVRVSIEAPGEDVRLEVRDDGAGFDDSVEQGESHRGLRNMRLRVQRLGGSFDMESAPGAGTTLRVRMPLEV